VVTEDAVYLVTRPAGERPPPEPAMDRTRSLNRELVRRIRQGRLGEQWLRDEIAVRRHLVDDQLALAFDRKVDPRLGRMKIEVPSTKAVSAIGRDLAHGRQHAVPEPINVERARVFRLACFRIVAARHHQDGFIRGSGADLMEIDALLQIVRLLHLVADAAIALDLVHRDVGGEVEGDQHMLAGIVDAQVNRPLPQTERVAMG